MEINRLSIKPLYFSYFRAVLNYLDTRTVCTHIKVFIGELDSTAPSYVELSVNNSQKQKIKCSGVLISTGTGSTAWSQNVNALGVTECDELNVALGQHGYQPGSGVLLSFSLNSF